MKKVAGGPSSKRGILPDSPDHGWLNPRLSKTLSRQRRLNSLPASQLFIPSAHTGCRVMTKKHLLKLIVSFPIQRRDNNHKASAPSMRRHCGYRLESAAEPNPAVARLSYVEPFRSEFLHVPGVSGSRRQQTLRRKLQACESLCVLSPAR